MMKKKHKLNVRSDSLGRIASFFGARVDSAAVLALTQEDLAVLRKRVDKVDKFWSIFYNHGFHWYLGLMLLSCAAIGFHLSQEGTVPLNALIVGTLLGANGASILTLLVGVAVVSGFHHGARVLKDALAPLSESGWRCKNALDLVSKWDCCKQHRDAVLEQNRELLNLDLRAMETLAKDAEWEQIKATQRATCAQLHGLEPVEQ